MRLNKSVDGFVYDEQGRVPALVGLTTSEPKTHPKRHEGPDSDKGLQFWDFSLSGVWCPVRGWGRKAAHSVGNFRSSTLHCSGSQANNHIMILCSCDDKNRNTVHFWIQLNMCLSLSQHVSQCSFFHHLKDAKSSKAWTFEEARRIFEHGWLCSILRCKMVICDPSYAEPTRKTTCFVHHRY